MVGSQGGLMELANLLGIVNIIGIAASGLVYLRRAGFSELRVRNGVDWREFLLPNPLFFGLTLAKMVFWFGVLIVWLVRDRPASPWRAVVEINNIPVRRVIRVANSASELRRASGWPLGGTQRASDDSATER
jgi:hypothetical protein